jgi:hypothetical protein
MSVEPKPLHWVLVIWETGGTGPDGQEERRLHYLSSHDQAAVEALTAFWVERHVHPELPCMVTYLGVSALPLQPPPNSR